MQGREKEVAEGAADEALSRHRSGCCGLMGVREMLLPSRRAAGRKRGRRERVVHREQEEAVHGSTGTSPRSLASACDAGLGWQEQVGACDGGHDALPSSAGGRKEGNPESQRSCNL